MNVGFITPYYPPFIVGGAEISLQLLASEIAGQNHNVSIFTPDYNGPDRIEGKNPKVYRLAWEKEYDPYVRERRNIASRFAHHILATKPVLDIVDSYLWHTPAKIVADRLGIPFVASIRSTFPYCPSRINLTQNHRHCQEMFGCLKCRIANNGSDIRRVKSWLFTAIARKKVLRVLKSAECITFASQALLELFEDYNDNLEIISSICSSENNVQPYPKEKIGLSTNDFSIVYAGRMSEGKGVRFLLDTAKSVLRKKSNVKFIFIGKGNLAQEIQNSDEFKNGHIIYVEKMDQAEILSIFKMADLVAVPSIQFEGFPRTAIESIAVGTPVVGTRVGGVPEAIGNCGICVAPGDLNGFSNAIVQLIDDAELRHKYSVNTMEERKKYLPEYIANRVLNIYKRLL